jgi:Ser/Thr protein kinase RdoA (MazF antagonist)
MEKTGLEEINFFYEYMINEAQRNLKRIKNYISQKELLSEIEEKSNYAINSLKNKLNLNPSICWYDINPNNILVDEFGKITGFLDAGGARFAPKELDLAFIKMDLCKNKDEFNFFINEYSKKNNVDMELLNILTIFVELDDIAFQLEANVKLPISSESNFFKLIKYLQENLIK